MVAALLVRWLDEWWSYLQAGIIEDLRDELGFTSVSRAFGRGGAEFIEIGVEDGLDLDIEGDRVNDKDHRDYFTDHGFGLIDGRRQMRATARPALSGGGMSTTE